MPERRHLSAGGQRRLHLSVSSRLPRQELPAEGGTLSSQQVSHFLLTGLFIFFFIIYFMTAPSSSSPLQSSSPSRRSSRSPCLNGGLCEDADGFAAELTCRCLAGFSGSRCQTNLDDCLMQPCANGATCLDGVNRFSCVCPAGFSGRFCTINRDDCASGPCQNGARCLDRAAGFRCVCPPGFAGATCETPLRALPEWDGGGGAEGGAAPRLSDEERLLKVTVSERSGAPGGLSQVQLLVLLLMAAATVAAVALTAGLVLQRRCRRNCGCRLFDCRASGQQGAPGQKSGWRGEVEKMSVGGGQEVTS